MKPTVVAVLFAIGLVACDEGEESLVLGEEQQYVFDCSDAQQRFTCDPPDDPGKRFVCHATSSSTNPYNKIAVPVGSGSHVPGVAHNAHKPRDQAPGASGADVGSGPGLDCECNVRICTDVCTGAADGNECDDNDVCTTDGTCAGGACEPGAPRCVGGTTVDACNVESGVCDPDTGACGTTPVPPGTACGGGLQCDDGGVCNAVDVVFNEVESNGGVPGDWVELYNAGPTTAWVGGWVFKDSDDTHAYAIPAGTTIPAGAYLVLDEAQFGFGLGGADAARLFDGTTLIDVHAWTTHAITTYARCPDGVGAFRTATTSTKGAANDCSVHVNVNEVESSGGTPGDWVELYNAGPVPADVGGYRFLDNDDTHVAYVIPAGTVIASGGHLVLEEAQFGFGLGAADSARLFAADGAIADAYAWTAHAVTTYGRCPNGTGMFRATSSATKNAANDCSVGVAINEVESSGGVPGDWVELHNTGVIPFDISGWVFKDADDTHAYALPPGTSIAPGGYLALEEAAFGFGLGAVDSARLFDAGGALVDSYAWTAHAATTYGRCPNGTGPFATTATVTKNAANGCGGTNPPPAAWPGQNAVTTVDDANTYGTNLSGLFHDGTDLWAVQNGPSTLYQVGVAQWTLRYPSGTGVPDAEDLTIVGGFVYVSTERDNDASAVSRPSILRFDPSASGELFATHEWNLAADLPVIGANAGLEAITWIPDSFLVANGFVDQTTNTAYNPGSYPNHGTGLFFVGLEANGRIYAYALDHVGGGYVRVASFASGDVTSKALSFDPESGYLWQHCGAACGGQTRVLVPGTGSFVTKRVFDRPTSMANIQNEGIGITACAGGAKDYYWADDSQTDGHALRVDTVPCGAFIP